MDRWTHGLMGRPSIVHCPLPISMRTCVRMVVCVLFSRFALVAALEGRRELMGEPVALAPEAGQRQVVGEGSPAAKAVGVVPGGRVGEGPPSAEAFGVVPGMRVGEALARCSELRLVPPDPDGVRSMWRRALDRLAPIGGAVQPDRAGGGCFRAGGR